MLMSFYQDLWVPAGVLATVQTDPMRMAQGIMTGIGFLGAGAIFREGLTVRGLTTAASIWTTAALGILIGVGLYYPAALATIITLGVLSLFRFIESRLPAQSYALVYLRFGRNEVMPEETVKNLLAEHGFRVANMGYRTTEDNLFEYRMVVRSSDREDSARLAEVLRSHGSVRGFRISRRED
jgi:putative Mg2+ transporter-C (MgtC) family protein